jgi:hypothetical protein
MCYEHVYTFYYGPSYFEQLSISYLELPFHDVLNKISISFKPVSSFLQAVN